MRDEIRELEEDILDIIGRTFSSIEFNCRKSAHFIVTDKLGLSESNLLKLHELCEKENMEFYISTKFFTNKITICISEKD